MPTLIELLTENSALQNAAHDLREDNNELQHKILQHEKLHIEIAEENDEMKTIRDRISEQHRVLLGEFIRVQEMLKSAEKKIEAIENIPPIDTCCCGDAMEGHGYDGSHTKLSMYAHSFYLMEKEIETQKELLRQRDKRIQDAEAALEFYGDEGTYNWHYDDTKRRVEEPVLDDWGKLARAYFEKWGEK